MERSLATLPQRLSLDAQAEGRPRHRILQERDRRCRRQAMLAAQMQKSADKKVAAVSIIITAARPVGIVGKILEHQVEQVHRLCDLGFRHSFGRGSAARHIDPLVGGSCPRCDSIPRSGLFLPEVQVVRARFLLPNARRIRPRRSGFSPATPKAGLHKRIWRDGAIGAACGRPLLRFEPGLIRRSGMKCPTVHDFLNNSDRCALDVLRQPKSSPTRWRSAWTARAAAWTTSSSSDCGEASGAPIEEVRFAADSPPEGAVSSEPVSEPQFPVSWENTGNFIVFWASRRKLPTK
jgi:hypothetical protein